MFIRFAFVGWTIFMLFLFLKPGSGDNSTFLFKGEDKLAHAFIFSLWAIFFYFLYELKSDHSPLRITLAIFLIGALVGGATEWVQMYIPNRTCSYFDFLADLIGVLLGLLISIFIKKELISTGNKFDK